MDRCTEQNEQLVHELRQKSRENKDICERMQALDAELLLLKNENARVKLYYDETLALLSQKLQSMEISHQEYVVSTDLMFKYQIKTVDTTLKLIVFSRYLKCGALK